MKNKSTCLCKNIQHKTVSRPTLEIRSLIHHHCSLYLSTERLRNLRRTVFWLRNLRRTEKTINDCENIERRMRKKKIKNPNAERRSTTNRETYSVIGASVGRFADFRVMRRQQLSPWPTKQVDTFSDMSRHKKKTRAKDGDGCGNLL